MVGATIATMPFELPRHRRAELQRSPALELIRSLIGDASDTVRKSLSWALRSWREVDPRGVDELLRAEARKAAETNDGNRAWVIRDAIKEQRTLGARSTSGAAARLARRRSTSAGRTVDQRRVGDISNASWASTACPTSPRKFRVSVSACPSVGPRRILGNRES